MRHTVRLERRSYGLLAFLTFACTIIVACGRDESGASGTEKDRSNAAITWIRSFDLYEDSGVINVNPRVEVDPHGGFLVADASEAQLRRYALDGRLHWRAGAKGNGPGEFQAPTALARLRSGEVLVSDRSGKFTVFDSSGISVTHTSQTPFRQVEDLVVLDDSLILVSAMHKDSVQGPRLHIWNLKVDAISRSYFSPLKNALNKTAAVVAGWSKVTIRADTVAAVFATSDTVYFFTLSGRPLGTVPLPFRQFRRVGRDAPRAATDPITRAKWLGSFDMVGDVHWLSNGDLLIPYQSVIPDKALNRTWHLLRMTRTGEPIFEVRDVPRLFAVGAQGDSLYFTNPKAEAPNQWSVARLR